MEATLEWLSVDILVDKAAKNKTFIIKI